MGVLEDVGESGRNSGVTPLSGGNGVKLAPTGRTSSEVAAEMSLEGKLVSAVADMGASRAETVSQVCSVCSVCLCHNAPSRLGTHAGKTAKYEHWSPL